MKGKVGKRGEDLRAVEEVGGERTDESNGKAVKGKGSSLGKVVRKPWGFAPPPTGAGL